MTFMIAGLVLFFAAHTLTTARESRAVLIQRIGEGPYKGLYSLVSLAGLVLVELKAGKALDSSHEAQLLNYLRSREIEVGLLFNFGPRPQVRRFAFENERKGISVHLR